MDFKNQALLSYNGKKVSSNIVEGSTVSPFKLEKYTSQTGYMPGDEIVYTIVVTNTLNSQVEPVLVFDDLGKYDYGIFTRFPIDFSMLLASLTIVSASGPSTGVLDVSVREDGVMFSFMLPAHSTAFINYIGKVNSYAPLISNSSIDNNVTLNVAPYDEVITSNTISVLPYSDVRISKSTSTENVTLGSPFTYTFVVTNYGNTAYSPQVSDVLGPYLTEISVYGDGVQLTEGTQYTYELETGYLNIPAGVFTLPSATFSNDPLGRVITTPSSYEITVIGKIASANAEQPYINVVSAYPGTETAIASIQRNSNLSFSVTLTTGGNLELAVLTDPTATLTLINTDDFSLNNNILSILRFQSDNPPTAEIKVEYKGKEFTLRITYYG